MVKKPRTVLQCYKISDNPHQRPMCDIYYIAGCIDPKNKRTFTKSTKKCDNLGKALLRFMRAG